MPPLSPAHSSIQARCAEAVPRGLAIAHPKLAVARAEGARVWDEVGQEYLDFACGIGVQNVGHRHPRVVAAVAGQLTRLTHMACQVGMYDEYVQLASRLNALVGGPARKTLLVTTGAEATENAVKIARAYTKRQAVIAFTGGFHGRTMLALAMTASNPGYQQNFGPRAGEIYHAPFPYEYRGWTSARALEELHELFATRVAPEQVAALIIEPQLGEGGFVPAPPDFLRALRDLTHRHGIVLIADEIQTGFGRTGRMFAYEHAGIEPDLVAIAKSLAAGLPLAAVVGTAAIMDAPAPGGLGGTYGGNPLACAAALAVLDVFQSERLVERAVAIGDELRTGLLKLQQRLPVIGDVRGLGAMLAIELVSDRASKTPDAASAQRLIERALDAGLILLKCGPHKNVVRFLPPLITTSAQVQQALQILEGALS
jgi:4-aminobutyrate aminotransferase/(S)-3-amino-2-methylpropionate transaminase